jgi:hypothetical protein
MPRLLFTPRKYPVPIVQEAGWVPEPVWTGAENLSPTRTRSLDLPSRSSVAIPTELPVPPIINEFMYNYMHNFTYAFFYASCTIQLIQAEFIKAIIQNLGYGVAIFGTFLQDE